MNIKKGVCLMLMFGCFEVAYARINFGSKQSAFKFAGTTKFTVPSDLLIDEGTIQRALTATFGGAPIRFTSGILGIGDTDCSLTGNYDYDADYGVILNGNKTFSAQPGITTPKIVVSGTGNRLEGDVNFAANDALYLADTNAALTLALNSGVNKNIALNGGTISLESSLAFGDNVIFSGGGTVNGNGNCLFLGGNALTWPAGTMHWKNSTIIYLNGNVTLQGRWNFYNTCYIIGNGNFLDINGGKLRVMDGSTLYLCDVKIKGLDNIVAENRNTLEFGNGASQVRFNRVEAEMDTDVTLTTGGIYVENSSTVITKDNELEFALGSSLTVDGCVLWYEALRYNAVNRILPISDPNTTRLCFLDGGIVKSLNFNLPGGIYIDENSLGQVIIASPDIQLRDAEVPEYPLSQFFNVSAALPVTVATTANLNGNGNIITFGSSVDSLVNISAAVTLTFLDIVLSNFAFDFIFLAHSTSHVYFGDKTIINLGKNCTLSTTYTFNGNCELHGNGKTITFGAHSGLEVNAGSSLLLDDVVLKDLSNTQLRCLDNTGTISFQKVTMYLDDDYFFDKGRFEIKPGSLLDVHGSDSFVYQSSLRSFVDDGATLQMTNAIFYYAPSVANRDLIVFNGTNANIDLFEATLASTPTGMRLTHGNFNSLGKLCHIRAEGINSLSEGIMVGDAITASNNMTLNKGVYQIERGIFIWANL